MSMKKLFCALLFLLAAMTVPAWAANVPGDVLVVFKNPTGTKVSAASLATATVDKPEGEHRSYAVSAAASVGAKVAVIYNALSEADNNIMALLHSDTKSERELLAELKARSDVKGVALNYLRQPCADAFTPNDKYYDMLWGMEAINAPEVWAKARELNSSEKVYVAVIDTGIDTSHEDLQDNVIATEYCIGYTTSIDTTGSNEISAYQDMVKLPHGTHVSGTIAAVGDNEKGVVGVAAQGAGGQTRVIMLKAYVPISGDEYSFPDSVTIAALGEVYRLKQSGVNIAALNMSLGGWGEGEPDAVSNEGDPYWQALKNISDLGVVICISAGNENQRVGYPAPDTAKYSNGEIIYEEGNYVYPASFRNIPNKIVVAAAKQDGSNIVRSALGEGEAGSNYGSEYVEITAPGSHIVSSVVSGYEPENDTEIVETGVTNYSSWPGTSMATPHVAGAVAILKTLYPNATGEQIKAAILDGANGSYCKNDKKTVTYDDDLIHIADNTSKYGFLDVKAAMDKLAASEQEKATEVENWQASNLPAGGKSLSVNDIADYGFKITDLDSELQAAANSGNMKYVKVLPQIRPIESGKYYIKISDFDVKNLSGTLKFFSGANGTVSTSSLGLANDTDIKPDGTAKFYGSDTTWEEITTFNDSDTSLIVAANLTANTNYTPVVSVQTADDSMDSSSKGSSSGCDAGLGGFVYAALGSFVLSFLSFNLNLNKK